MLTEEVVAPRAKTVTSAPSLATDLSWLLSVAARPSMQARYPKLAEMFKGREDLAGRVRTFWNDTAEETCFTEMQVLAQLAGALGATDPGELWSAMEGAVASVPLDLAMPSEAPEDREIFLDRFRRLRQSPELVRSYFDLLDEVWAPVDDMWQQALPVIEEAGRQIVAQYERGRSLEQLIPEGVTSWRSACPRSLPTSRPGNRSCSSPACSSVRACTWSSPTWSSSGSASARATWWRGNGPNRWPGG